MNESILVSSKQVIARLLDGFKVDTSDWIIRSALWIQDAMFDMQLVKTFSVVRIPVTISGYKALIPPGLRSIEAVEINQKRLYRLDQINITTANIQDIKIGVDTYEVTTTGHLLFGVEEGEAFIYARSMPLEPASEGNTVVLYPMIPNNFLLFEALEFYILLKLLQKGLKHPVFSLDSQNPVTNVYSRWKEARRRAQNNVTALSFDERNVISYEIRKLIHFEGYEGEVLFKGNKTRLGKYNSPSGNPLAPVVLHTVIFKNWDNTVLSTQSIIDGGNAIPPSDPVRPGYTFTGWSGDYINITEDVEIIATYSNNSDPDPEP